MRLRFAAVVHLLWATVVLTLLVILLVMQGRLADLQRQSENYRARNEAADQQAV